MDSRSEIHEMDLIDMLSERHHMLRRITESSLNDNSDIYISSSEWYILARIYNKQPSISSITKSVNISRQAIHKFIKKLADKELVEVHNAAHNKKEKCVQLTALGNACYEKNEALKAQLENKLAEKIGEEQFNTLKEILQLDWNIEQEEAQANN